MITAGKIDGLINLPSKKAIPNKPASKEEEKKSGGAESINSFSSSAATGAMLDIALRYAIFELKLVGQDTREEIGNKIKKSFEEPEFIKDLDKKRLERHMAQARVDIKKADRAAQAAISAVNIAVNVPAANPTQAKQRIAAAEGALADAQKAMNQAAESVMMLECCVQQLIS